MTTWNVGYPVERVHPAVGEVEHRLNAAVKLLQYARAGEIPMDAALDGASGLLVSAVEWCDEARGVA